MTTEAVVICARCRNTGWVCERRSLSLRHTTHSTHLGVDCETREAGHGPLPDVWEQQGGNT
jgi:hypothetical protein